MIAIKPDSNIEYFSFATRMTFIEFLRGKRGQGLPSDRYCGRLYNVSLFTLKGKCLLAELFLWIKFLFSLFTQEVAVYKAGRELTVKGVKKCRVATFIELIYLIK